MVRWSAPYFAARYTSNLVRPSWVVMNLAIGNNNSSHYLPKIFHCAGFCYIGFNMGICYLCFNCVRVFPK